MVAPYVDFCNVVRLPRLDLNVEMSWYHSLVQSVGQCVLTLLSMLLSYRINMDVQYVSTSGLSIHLYREIPWLYWDTN